MAVVVHQRRLSGIDRDRKGADKHVFKHKVMAGFSGDFHGRLSLLCPGGQGEHSEQSHERKFSHREAILDQVPSYRKCSDKTSGAKARQIYGRLTAGLKACSTP